MSSDWELRINICDKCKRSDPLRRVSNVTSNDYRILRYVGFDPKEKKGKVCKDLIPEILHSLRELLTEKNFEELKKLEPISGYGGIDSSRNVLRKLLSFCYKYPDALFYED